jgi:hypothetical protein
MSVALGSFGRVRHRSRDAQPLTEEALQHRTIQRRITVIWGLLLLNVIETNGKGILLPHSVARVVTQLALIAAIYLAYTLNRRLVWRPQLFLELLMAIAVAGLFIGLAVGTFHSDLRALRYIGLVFALWLMTPWFGRLDRTVLRAHLTVLLGLLGMVLLGIVVAPGRALHHGRLASTIWPITATQVAHYAAVAAGISAVAFISHTLPRRLAAVSFLVSTAILLATHTRTALAAMLVGVIVAAVSLVSTRRRARLVLAWLLALAAVTTMFLQPQVKAWVLRSPGTTQLTELSGRAKVWAPLESQPRTKAQVWFGHGFDNASFDGLPIDNSWLALYTETGLVGDILAGLGVLVLVYLVLMRPRGPSRAFAIFLILYCLVASFTETGLGLPSPYLLDLTAAAALLAPVKVVDPDLVASMPDVEDESSSLLLGETEKQSANGNPSGPEELDLGGANS